MQNQAVTLLKATRRLLARSEWIKGTPCGNPWALVPQHCALSALKWSAMQLGMYPQQCDCIARETLAQEIVNTFFCKGTIPTLDLIPWYNDRAETSFDDVMALLDRAIAAAENPPRASGVRLVS